MIQRVMTLAIGFLLVTLAIGCGCGDRAAYRSITITEMRGVDSGAWGPIEVDTSQLPGIERGRAEHADGCGNPISELRLFSNRPIKIMIVPATQPVASK
ncbi:MAG: hypothetical protein JWM57_1304 [Phycisphaerales bacterium]|nr:hypothetical protein [Phycisphaerales bacterium]